MIATRLASAIALGGLLSLSAGTTFNAPKIEKIEQNTRTVEWASVTRATVGQMSSRMIRLTGPWMDFVSSATTSNGVSARNIQRDFPNRKVTMILDASASALRGDMTLKLNIACPPVSLDCTSSVQLPLKIFETGPIAGIAPYGNVPPNTTVTFDLSGEALGVAKLLPRLLTLKNASVLSRTATTMRVRGTTPSCGYIDVALTDEADGDEFPYRKGTSLQPVLAGTICGQSLAPPTLKSTLCPAGQHYDYTTHTCKP